MTEQTSRKLVLEGGDYDGVEYNLANPSTTGHVYAETLVLRLNGVEYRSCGEVKDGREVMVYDG